VVRTNLLSVLLAAVSLRAAAAAPDTLSSHDSFLPESPPGTSSTNRRAVQEAARERVTAAQETLAQALGARDGCSLPARLRAAEDAAVRYFSVTAPLYESQLRERTNELAETRAALGEVDIEIERLGRQIESMSPDRLAIVWRNPQLRSLLASAWPARLAKLGRARGVRVARREILRQQQRATALHVEHEQAALRLVEAARQYLAAHHKHVRLVSRDLACTDRR